MSPPVDPTLEALRARLAEINDLMAALCVLLWDQATHMPPKGSVARGRQVATLGRIVHERQVDPELGRLLGALEARGDDVPGGPGTRTLLRVARRDFERAVRIPSELVAEMKAHQALGYDAWRRARPVDDFAAVRPVLERTLQLSRRLSACFPGQTHVADPLIDFADHGMSAAWIAEQFTALERRLVPLVQAVSERVHEGPSCLEQHFPEADQLAFGEEVTRLLGYDYERGRQDKTAHPFMTRMSHGDVRITTRVDENDLSEALFGTIHETGHALYEQGIDELLEGTPLARGTSSGVHESQSRLWENLVGRSHAFWEFFYPRLQARFPEQLGLVRLDRFHRDINRVERSLIRTEADELTYNLHVMLRFQLELDLLEGRLAVAELPQAWSDRMEEALGLRPSTDRDGVLQDVHWYAGVIGGEFQGYTLGNVMSAQFFEAARREHPEIDVEISQGRFGTLLSWLTEHVYRWGRQLDAAELVERATGEPFTIEPYLAYLTHKYGELYQL
jgi:carboxypeptidase Taq